MQSCNAKLQWNIELKNAMQNHNEKLQFKIRSVNEPQYNYELMIDTHPLQTESAVNLNVYAKVVNREY